MTERAACWLAGHGIAPARPAPVPLADLVAAARVHRLMGLLARVIAEGAVAATASERDEVNDLAAAGAWRSVMLEALLVRSVERFRARGLDPVVLKGAAVAHLDHGHTADREFIDLDLLVRADQLAATVSLLEVDGYHRNLPERRPGFDVRFAKDVTMQRGTDPEYDLHVRPAFGPFGQRVPVAELFERTEHFTVAGIDLVALDGPGRLVHACCNAVLADARPKVSAMRDVAVMVAAGKVPLAVLRERARAWGAEAVVATAVAQVWRVLALPVEGDIPDWAVEHRPSRVDRWLLRTSPSQGGSVALCMLAGVAGLPGLRDRLDYLAGFVRPSRDYRAARVAAARVGEYREGARQLIRVVRRRG